MKNVLILAWTEQTGLRDTGRLEQRDSNWFPKMEVCTKACACVFSRDLSANMRARASDYAAGTSQGAIIIEMPDTEDCLDRARAFVLKESEAGK